MGVRCTVLLMLDYQVNAGREVVMSLDEPFLSVSSSETFSL